MGIGGTPMSKVYKIYIKDKCVYDDLKEEDFRATWSSLQGMVGLMKTDYDEKDLSYRCCKQSISEID